MYRYISIHSQEKFQLLTCFAVASSATHYYLVHQIFLENLCTNFEIVYCGIVCDSIYMLCLDGTCTRHCPRAWTQGTILPNGWK